MKQSGLRQTPEFRDPESSAAGRTSRSIDEWLEAAVAEQANRAAARGAARRAAEAEHPGPLPLDDTTSTPAVAAPSPVVPDVSSAPDEAVAALRAAADPAGSDYGSLVAATEASERRAIETANKTAVALGSVASWIERAQEKLNETERVASEAQARTAAAVTDAIDAIGSRLDQIEKKVEAVGSADGPENPASAFDEVLRGFETRIQEMADRLVVRPIGRRGVPVSEEVDAAVAEIRAHQAHLAAGPSPRRAESSGATEAALRAQADLLTGLRSDIDRLAQTVATPPAAAVSPAPHAPGIESLRGEIDALQASVSSLVTRDDLGDLQRSVAGLSQEIAEIGRSGGNLEPVAGEVNAIEAEVHRFGQIGAAGEQLHRLTRDIDVMSHKLDIVSSSGVDKSLVEGLSRDVSEMRSMLAGLAMPSDIASLSEQLIELKIEMARIGSRQVDARDFDNLRVAVDELKTILSAPAPAYRAEAYEAPSGSVTREELQPIAGMLVQLIDRLDRMEKASDTDGIEQLERQIASLSAAISDGARRDPGLATLSNAMTGLMAEIAGWREGTAAIAERAAREAVAETLAAREFGAPVGRIREESRDGDEAVRHAPVAGPGWAPDVRAMRSEPVAPENRADVHARLDDVVRRARGLDTATIAVSPELPRVADLRAQDEDALLAPSEPIAPVAAEPAHMEPAPAPVIVESGPAEADQPLDWSPKDEILLEPGAARPAPATGREPDAADIKASFIAAARRAAQAAAADANATGKGKASRPADLLSPGTDETTDGMVDRLRSVLARARKPLLLAATALLVAFGGYELLKDYGQGTAVSTAGAPPLVASPPIEARPQVAAPAPISTAPSAEAQPDPTTTQSVPERAVPPVPALSPARIESREQAAAEPTRPAQGASLGASVPAAAPSAPALRPADNNPLAGLKLAAGTGDATALYDLASRTADGRGVARDPRAAVTLFEQAAEKNLAPAQYRTGNFYEKGIGVPRDIDAARKWYLRAAENGNTRAMHNLAVLLAEGVGGRPDYGQAIGWFQRAAEHGVRDSQFNLAVLHARGLGTPQDLVKSYTWFAVASGQGDDEAAKKRDEVGQRLSTADLARAKATAERWRMTPASAAANEVQIPASYPTDGAKRGGSLQKSG